MDFFLTGPGRALIFVLLTAFFTTVSWRPLHNPRCHGYYRYFVFEGILLLFVSNLPHWFENKFSLQQRISWFLLTSSLGLVLHSLAMLKIHGGNRGTTSNPENFAFENTSELVRRGIYRYIRHPMYTSLLLLAWGILLKQVTLANVIIAVISTAFMAIAAQKEELENLAYFGQDYRDYAKETRRFIPFLF
jgi:protein-S-isoprenylcysteine O-methyltransferase Ste14